MPPRNVTDTAATITHLLRNTTYDVQVRAKNADGDGPWSESGSGTTGKNTAPSFGATSTTRSVAENTEPGQAIGGPVAATDPDSGDTLTYRLEGTDAAAFGIDEANGQLRTSAALDYETRSSYSVTVVAEDSEGASASIEVTIAVTNANEPPSFDPTTTRAAWPRTPSRGRPSETRCGHGPRFGRHADLPPGGHGCGGVRHRRGQLGSSAPAPRSTTRRGRATR